MGVRALFSDLVGAVQQQSLQAGPWGKGWTSPPFAKLFLVLNFVLLNAKLCTKCTKSWDFESEFFFPLVFEDCFCNLSSLVHGEAKAKC